MEKQKVEELLKMDLAEALGFTEEDLKDKEVQEVIAQAEFVIIRGVWLKVFELLSEDKQEALASLLEKNPEDQKLIIDFLQKELPDYENIIKTEVANYKERLISKSKVAR